MDEKELLSAYIDNALSDYDRNDLEARLKNEPALARELESLRQTDAILLAAYDEPMTQSVPRRFFDVLGLLTPTIATPHRTADGKSTSAANDNGAPWWCVSPKIVRALNWARGQSRL